MEKVPPSPSPDAAELQAPSSQTVHEAIVAEGVEELARPTAALAWSALAGGLSMGFSLVAEAMLRAHLPEAAWRSLVAKLGYSVGFLIVILGRQQLFTENTLTPILPLLERKVPVALSNVLRLWTVVLLGNLIGGLIVAVVFTHTAALSPDTIEAVKAIARESVEPSFGVIVLRGIFADWLIALIVWVMPAAETAHVWVILVITYVIGVAHFSHVIAGSINAFALASAGELGWAKAFAGFTLPALLGNILGGVGLVACLNHAQVRAGEH